MMNNIIARLRDTLEKNNYIRKADPNRAYFFDFSKAKLDLYLNKFGENFNLIIYGSDDIEDDFFVLPFSAFKHIFRPQNLAIDGRNRWLGTIVFNELRVTHDRIRPDIFAYRGNLNLLELETPATSSFSPSAEIQNDYSIENRKIEIKVRQRQSLFRKRVLSNFDNKCCISGIDKIDLLIASHIVPWAHLKESRLDPSNGLCLFVLYDSLFDQGYLSFTDELIVIITPNVEKLNPQLAKMLYEIQGRQIKLPKNHPINPIYIQYHREYIFGI